MYHWAAMTEDGIPVAVMAIVIWSSMFGRPHVEGENVVDVIDLSITRSSKLVSHPLALSTLTLAQAAVQPVVIVAMVSAATEAVLGGWAGLAPLQVSVTVEALAPPLKALSSSNCAGFTKVKLALRWDEGCEQQRNQKSG
jgi:hypothetical protein